MRESEFAELRTYAEAEGSCIDMGYRPAASLTRNGWLREIVRGCWAITPNGSAAFAAVVAGTADLRPDEDTT